MIKTENAANLLSFTKSLIKLQNEMEVLKGETFNVFSILQMERKETRTHTPLLAELLNPTGSHKKGNLFLRLFLETINIQSVEKIKDFISDNAKVYPNRYIGPVDIRDGFESGGNLDIYIEDINKRGITIENKIDENTEQQKQVVRYCNYKKNANTVFYLTPFGTKPSPYSSANLESGTDYFIISYKIHIIDWLKKCIRETLEQPILRETIRQYIILLQKITYTMENEQLNDLNILMLNYFEEATYINANFNGLKRKIGEEIRMEVIRELKEKFHADFNIHSGSNTSNINSQIWIKYKKHDNAKLFFGIESFSSDKNQIMDVGIFSINGESTFYATC